MGSCKFAVAAAVADLDVVYGNEAIAVDGRFAVVVGDRPLHSDEEFG